MAVIDQYKQIQENIANRKPTENALAKAKYYGYTEDQINQEMNKLQPNTAPQPVSTPQITPTPATIAPQPQVAQTPQTAQQPTPQVAGTTIQPAVTTPTATVEKDILSPNVTGYVNPNQAKLEQANLNKLNSNVSLYSTGKSLYDAVQGGSLLPWTKEFTDLTTRNPNVLAEYNQIKAEKEKNDTVKTLGQAIVWEPIAPKPSNALEQLVSFFTKSMDTDVAGEYQNSVIKNPAYQNSIQTLNGINQQIADNNKNINALREDVRKKYSAWTPESLIASAIAREARPLIEQGQYLTQLQQNAQAEMTRLFEENKQVFDLKQEEITNNRNIALQLYGTIRAEEIRAEGLAIKDKELKQQMEKAKTEQEYNQLKDQRDYNLKVAEALSKEDYQNRQLELQGRTKASDYLKFEVENEDWSKSTVYRNPTNWQEISPWNVYGNTPSTSQGQDAPIGKIYNYFSPAWQALLSVPDGTVVPTRLGEVSPQNAQVRGKECAEFVNDIYGNLLPSKLGSTYQDKLAVCNEPTGGIGSVAAWKPQGSGTFGHVGIIVDEDANNYYIKSSNYTPWTVTTVPVPKDNINNFYTPKEIKTAQSQEDIWPKATRYANGNVRTADGILYTNKEVSAINKDIIKNDNYKAILTSQDLNDKLTQFEEVFKKYGTEVGLDKLKFNRTGATALQNTYTSLLLTAKEFFNLWVLNWPDLAILTAGMPSPVEFELPSEWWRTTTVPWTFLNSKVEEWIERMRQMIKQKLDRDYSTVNQSFWEFGEVLPALRNAKSVYQSFSPEMEDVNTFTNQNK